jgi:L-seryl-tRNA(Ser) seleniumtransferase
LRVPQDNNQTPSKASIDTSTNTRAKLPAMDKLLATAAMAQAIEKFGRERVKHAIREIQQPWRAGQNVTPEASDPQRYPVWVQQRLAPNSYQRVFNLTGTTIHTNLGRSPLSKALWREAEALVTEPMNLEFDLNTGRRGQREQVVAERLCQLTGAEAACLVNNNAAALMLVLNTLGLNREVPVSRGELIEIGGSFRLPELMQRSGCHLVEVGTTNRTHERDYANAINDQTAMLLKVHPSNFHVEGFTHTTDLKTLAQLAQQHQLPLVEDLGSGTLVDLTRYGLPAEPMPQQSLQAGVDMVTFSGDKLLGGTQAGIILGRRDLIDQINQNPLKRALRLDKVGLVLLDKTLAIYEQPERLQQEIPILATLTTPMADLEQRAAQLLPILQRALPSASISCQVCEGQIGSGALPSERIASRALVIEPGPDQQANALSAAMRQLPIPVIARVAKDALWLDMRGAVDVQTLATNFSELTL